MVGRFHAHRSCAILCCGKALHMQDVDQLDPTPEETPALVCLEKIGPILKRAREGEGIGEIYGTSAIYAGADHREAA